jgi:asparagine synthase (glutamine-hydrolysing)
MCGIWGYTQFGTSSDAPNVKTIFETCMNVQKRGPDHSDFKQINGFIKLFLGFHRLAIMGQSTYSDQPFTCEIKTSTEHRSIYAICNGEIYNYMDLVTKYNLLETLCSKSDCEFIPHLYKIIGFSEMITQLRGEFAIAVIDIDHLTNKIVLHLGRDQTAVRPLFVGIDNKALCFSSILSGIVGLVDPTTIRQIKRAEHLEIVFKKDHQPLINSNIYHSLNIAPDNRFACLSDRIEDEVKTDKSSIPLIVLNEIRSIFIKAVKIRLESDRPIGALLSGGLDSSLVVSIAAKHLRTKGRRLQTFSIGLPGSTDKEYAISVSKYCDTDHTHIEFTDQDFLESIPNVIKATETYDITTVRASVGQFLISKWIAKNTDIKVLLIGDGSDELCSGYLYFHMAPNPAESHLENIKLLERIQYFDSLRADRCIAYNGIEARVPFLDHKFVELYLSIPHEYRVPQTHRSGLRSTEKWLLRASFDFLIEPYLPSEVLWRKKEAFSDGVSSTSKSWYQTIQDSVKTTFKEEDFNEESVSYHIKPKTAEALYYRQIYNKQFGYKTATVIPEMWMPSWCDASDPSARVLTVYE